MASQFGFVPEYESSHFLSNFEDSEYIDVNNYLDEGCVFYDDGIQIKDEEIINKDYNLNSGLNRDNLDGLLRLVRQKSGESTSRHNSLGLSFSAEVVKQIKGVNWEDVKGSEDFHIWFSKFVLSHNVITEKYRKYMKEWEDNVEDVPDIVDLFYQRLTKDSQVRFQRQMTKGKFTQIRSLEGETGIANWGSGFFSAHFLVLLMNSVKASGRNELLKHFKDAKLIELQHEKDWLVTGKDEFFGNFSVTSGYLYLHDHKRLLDLNLLLMIKDTLVARFLSIISILERDDKKYSPGASVMLNTLYRDGDRLLAELGNYGYDSIKLLESFCVSRFADCAKVYRPRIITDASYEDHLIESIRELPSKLPQVLSGKGGWLKKQVKKIKELIYGVNNPDDVTLCYGAFRHWGHPYIDYFEGLEKMHGNVNADSEIDEEYANLLASDLAYKVLKSKFMKERVWFIDKKKIPKNHPLFRNLRNNTWPTTKVLLEFGDHWHELPLRACFTMPVGIDPSALYSDKSHSMTLSQLKENIINGNGLRIKTERVLITACNVDEGDLVEYIKEIDERGLDKEDLVIGLMEKERELKRVGRFFTLMSWKMRKYFVITEYLIKQFFVPLFSGLTMADDLTEVMRKLMDRSSGQGKNDYTQITYANHMDYEKWNNFQRGKSNNPVFLVMGKFVGYPNLFLRTHEIFENSLIYYVGRRDLLKVENNQIVNAGEHRVCWQGQKGGMEGVRQKGWSIVNLLVLEREAKIRNTKVANLASGDNQVLCTSYHIPKRLSDNDLDNELKNIYRNNKDIMNSVEKGTRKLGLKINKDETLTSADFLIYGKVPVYRGNILNLESKRWSRVTTLLNDQIPTIGNVMSTVNTTALTVQNQSDGIIDSMVNHLFFGVFTLQLYMEYSILLQGKVKSLSELKSETRTNFLTRALYLDPALGGLSGMALTRFLVRQFPDPVTESLSFWKIFNNSNDQRLKVLSWEAGNPELSEFSTRAWEKLLEDPTALNLRKGLSPATMVKDLVRKEMITTVDTIKNPIFKNAVIYIDGNRDDLNEFLMGVKPTFPRFLSEFKASTYFGIAEGIVGLIQNSKTIRNMFKKRFARSIVGLMTKSENLSMKFLFKRPRLSGGAWDCSLQKAQELRNEGWAREIVATTIPHPFEYINKFEGTFGPCSKCRAPRVDEFSKDYLSAIFPQGLVQSKFIKGPYRPYLGSKTSDSTSLFSPWEKSTNIPLLKRSENLRQIIGWFAEVGKEVSESILNNLGSLTESKWKEDIVAYSRTGTPAHRYRSARQSPGGFIATSPNLVSYTMVSCDNMKFTNSKNFNLMYQSAMLYAQLVAVEVKSHTSPYACYHFHISCTDCLQIVPEIQLTSTNVYNPPNVQHLVNAISGRVATHIEKTRRLHVKQENWLSLPNPVQSFEVGKTIGALYGIMSVNGVLRENTNSLFPFVLRNLVSPKEFLIGISLGLSIASVYASVYHNNFFDLYKVHDLIEGSRFGLVNSLTRFSEFVSLCSDPIMQGELLRENHRVSPSYPVSEADSGRMAADYLFKVIRMKSWVNCSGWKNTTIFADFSGVKTTTMIVVGVILHSICIKKLDKSKLDQVKELKKVIEDLSDFTVNEEPGFQVAMKRNTLLNKFDVYKYIYYCSSEVRHALKPDGWDPRVLPPPPVNLSGWGTEYTCKSESCPVYYTTDDTIKQLRIRVPNVINPAVSGKRGAQLATGSHYKIRAILKDLGINPRGALMGGDGSGGITACVMRLFKCPVIFNSLLDMGNRNPGGVTPDPPSAVMAMPTSLQALCVNLRTIWMEPSDLAMEETWVNFKELKQRYGMEIDLMIFDMEVIDDIMSLNIVENLIEYVEDLLTVSGIVIYKIYGTQLLSDHTQRLLSGFGSRFVTVKGYKTQLTSSFSSEIYMVFRGRKLHMQQRLYVDNESLNDLAKFCYASKSISSEFTRAKSFLFYVTLAGVPNYLIPNIEDEVGSLLFHLGLPGAYSNAIVELLPEFINKNEGSFALLLGYLLLSNCICCTTAYWGTDPGVPSDQEVKKLAAVHGGIWMAFSMISDSVSLFNYAHKFCNNKADFRHSRWSYRTKKDGKLTTRVSWGWDEPKTIGGLIIKKNIPFGSMISTSGQIIRLAHRLHMVSFTCPVNYKILNHSIDKKLTKLNKALTFKHLLNSTDVFPSLLAKGKKSDISPADLIVVKRDTVLDINPGSDPELGGGGYVANY